MLRPNTGNTLASPGTLLSTGLLASEVSWRRADNLLETIGGEAMLEGIGGAKLENAENRDDEDDPVFVLLLKVEDAPTVSGITL